MEYWNTAQQLLRIILNFIGGLLISRGILTDELMTQLSGGIMSVASVAWWFIWNQKQIKS